MTELEKMRWTCKRSMSETRFIEPRRKNEISRLLGFHVIQQSSVGAHHVFDETDLDPATNWKRAWQNEDAASSCNGFVDLRDAMIFAAQLASVAEHQTLDQEKINKIVFFEPEWTSNTCQIYSISQFLGEK